MAQLNANPLLSIPGIATPGMYAAETSLPTGQSGLARLGEGLGGKILGTVGANAGLDALGLGALTTGSGLASALGIGAGLGSFLPGIGTTIGALIGAFLPNMFKSNRSAIGDIQAAQRLGRPITPQEWNQAGYGPGGGYLSAEQLLSPASGQKNNSPLRDIADALYNGESISDKSWSQASLPAGGGAYGAYLQQAMNAIRGQAGALGLPSSINSSGLSPQMLTSLSSSLPQYG